MRNLIFFRQKMLKFLITAKLNRYLQDTTNEKVFVRSFPHHGPHFVDDEVIGTDSSGGRCVWLGA